MPGFSSCKYSILFPSWSLEYDLKTVELACNFVGNIGVEIFRISSIRYVFVWQIIVFVLKPLWETENHSLIYFLKYQLKSTGRFKLIAGRWLKTSKIENWREDYRVSFTLLCWLKYLLRSFNSSLKAGEVSRQAVIYKCNKHKQNKFPWLNPINFSIASRTTKIMTMATIQVSNGLVQFYVQERKYIAFPMSTARRNNVQM